MELHSQADEGVLARARAGVVNTASLARGAERVGMDAWVRLGRAEEGSDGRGKPSILANVFEALLGALYLDGGLEPVRRFVRREFEADLADVGAMRRDAKTHLQEHLQADGLEPPEYRTVAEWGPDHAKEFSVEVWGAGRVLGTGSGRSKREAEQAAAQRALEKLAP